MPRRRLRIVVAAVVALVAVLGGARLAAAHGVLRASAPAADARLDAAPRALRLTFNEPVEISVARLELRGPDGAAVALSPLRRGDSAAVVVADSRGALAAGAYAVAWQIVGRDGHPVRGSYAFTILPGAAGLGDPGAPRGAGPPRRTEAAAPGAAIAASSFDAASPLYAAVRWLGFLGLLGAIGAASYGLAVAPRARGGASAAPPVRAIAAVGLAAAATLLAGALLRLAAQSAALHGADAIDPARVGALVRDTRWGAGWLLQVAAATVAAAGYAILARSPRAGWPLAVAGAVGAAVAAALSGHAAAAAERTVVAIGADALHVLAAGGWVGSLVLLVAVGMPEALRAAPGERAPRAAALLHAFSPLAIACAATLALTGAFAAWLHVGSLPALAGSRYGRLLLAKLALVAAMALLGAFNWRRARRAGFGGADAVRVRGAATLELTVGLLVLAATAVLVATPTPADAG